MTKQIYVNIVGGLICIALGFGLAVSILVFSKAIEDIRIGKDTSKKILSILEKQLSCNIDSSLQEKIEQTYENITSFKCTTNP